MSNPLRKTLTTVVAASFLTLAAAGTAWAHLEPEPEQVSKGSTPKVTFTVPNERPDAGTVKVRINFPTEHPIANVRPRTAPGWKMTLTKARLAEPVTRNNVTFTQSVTDVTWTAEPGVRIGPGEFAEFALTAGPMPTDTDSLVLRATQTYDSGEEVNWDQLPNPDSSEEPEHPAPALRLVTGDNAGKSSESAAPSTATEDQPARWIGGVALVMGTLGLGIGGGLVLRNRRASSNRAADLNEHPH